MLYAALGDSITYGYSATDDAHRFVDKVRQNLSRQDKVNVYLHAKPGWTSRQLLKSLKKVPECIWDEAKLVTLLVGGNDLLHATPWLLDGNKSRILKVADKYHETLTEIVQLVKRPNSTFIIMTLYNPFPNSVLAAEYTETLNKCIRQVARREGLVLADLCKLMQFKEHQFVHGYKRGHLKDFRIRGNPIHPNDQGHQFISQLLLRSFRRQSIGVGTMPKRRRKIGNTR